ncbi:CAP domain-containing protein [Jimgerdemannia flammicorona]|uniref:CAP domain-containing protein n=1 Tax=Jimgerdemannia flammicorona TaxID=994334 RepID=A0A433DK07_9FUNG|nr:CAP domain-containing protein [Jimgerdemannia flammicorona]
MLYTTFSTLFSFASLLLLDATSANPISLNKRAVSQSDIDSILQAHNGYRAKHGSPPLVWDTAMADFAANWADGCSVGNPHSGGKDGENVAFGYKDWTSAVAAWYDEGSEYDYNNPGFSMNTGHFTQVVWKATTKIGCGYATCNNHSDHDMIDGKATHAITIATAIFYSLLAPLFPNTDALYSSLPYFYHANSTIHQVRNVGTGGSDPNSLYRQNVLPPGSSSPQSSHVQPSNSRPSNSRPSNSRPSNLRPSNSRPSNLRPSNLRPSHARPSQLRPSCTRSPKNKPEFKASEESGNDEDLTLTKLAEPIKTSVPVDGN